ncbi:hypothetical protein ECB98_18980 [Brucellaceae bacterium VT-16-1752]|nr:hypothetical protein ECB98_18980 [Brucellaceae bacterium VT-16-1752]
MILELEFSEWIALASAVGALIAAVFAWRAAKQAKRQADAVLGDVPASFGAFQEETTGSNSVAQIRFEIVNHNRKALLVRKIWFENEAGVEVLKHHSDSTSLITDILNRAATGDASYGFEIPHRIKGCGSNNEPSFLILPFRARWKSNRFSFPLYFGCCYFFEGEKEDRLAYASVKVIPPSD